MRFQDIRIIYGKEVLDMVRDRRTLLSMVVVPLAALPVLFAVMNAFLTTAEKKSKQEAVTIGVAEGKPVPAWLEELRAAGLQLVPKPDLKAAVESKQVAAAVEEIESRSQRKEIRIYYDRTRQASDLAADNLESALGRKKDQAVRASLKGLGVPETVLDPFRFERVNVAPQRKMAGFFWGNILGYIVLLLMFTGGMYPAIDMTAGEKERRTLEMFLCSPAGREEIVLGKILAATTATFLTALLAMGSMVVSFRFSGFGRMSPALKAMMSLAPLDAPTMALLVAALLPVAVMAASILIAIALRARSFKEAQSYLTPLVMLVALPAVGGMLPGLELTPVLALVPILNVSQLIKEVLLGGFSRAAFAVTLLSNLVYAAVAFWFAVRAFKSESVLFRT